jgi:hypothetical protein
VYWGAPEVADLIPAESFIDMRQFDDFGDLRRFLHGLTQRQVTGYRDAARGFLESAAYDPFRSQAFVEHFRRFLREDLGVNS